MKTIITTAVITAMITGFSVKLYYDYQTYERLNRYNDVLDDIYPNDCFTLEDLRYIEHGVLTPAKIDSTVNGTIYIHPRKTINNK